MSEITAEGYAALYMAGILTKTEIRDALGFGSTTDDDAARMDGDPAEPAPIMRMAGNPMQPVLSGPAPICPRHKKSKAGKGGYYCPTPISPVGVEPKEWCDWRVAG